MSMGKPLPHDTAPLHVTGAARYVDDIPAPANTLHLAFGLSPVARGVLNGVELTAVKAAPGVVDVATIRGEVIKLRAPHTVIATGSRPRLPPEVPIDHEHILDSDSVLSLVYLPRTLTVLGAGVIASEYASVFQQLGVQVTMVDRGQRPVAFMDPELSDGFVSAFEDAGGRYLPGVRVESVEFDGIATVRTHLSDGSTVEADKVVCALGRVANVERLGLDKIGVELTRRGHIIVDPHYRTSAPGTYAVGDVIGFPALASTSMEQGRRAASHIVGEPVNADLSVVPVGIYTIPEMSSVGLSTEAAMERHGSIRVGRACFSEVSRAHIQGQTHGLIKLVAHGETDRLLGVHVLGSSAAELVHLGQVAMMAGWTLHQLIETTFNFPTMAESYRLAALDALRSEAVSAAA